MHFLRARRLPLVDGIATKTSLRPLACSTDGTSASSALPTQRKRTEGGESIRPEAKPASSPSPLLQKPTNTGVGTSSIAPQPGPSLLALLFQSASHPTLFPRSLSLHRWPDQTLLRFFLHRNFGGVYLRLPISPLVCPWIHCQPSVCSTSVSFGSTSNSPSRSRHWWKRSKTRHESGKPNCC